MLDEEACYRAVQGRDARFDGVFYIGVTSTGIYCRPSCPAMTPKRQNVHFYRTAAQAQTAGFRACRRCRPDATPGSAEWNVRADVVGRAMRLIADGVVDRDGVAGLAGRLGYSERQVHRTLVEEVGAGPLRLARSQRAHTARVLLETTELPVTEIGFAAGFSSIRQFNDTIREVYALTPSELRGRARRAGRHKTPGTIELRLAYRQPADLRGVLDFLAPRAVPGIEEVDGDTYRRSLTLPHGTGVAELTPRDGYVQATLRLADPRDLTAAVARCRRVLDLDADPQAVDDLLGADPALGPLVAAHPGRRVPGTVDGDELAVRGVLGQQISVLAARTVAGRLVAEHGKPLDAPVGTVTHAFPTASVLASVDPSSFPMPRSRQRTLHELTSRLADCSLRLDPGVDRDEAERQLLDVPGIGPWTARYVRMRALADPDVFLPTDLGVKHAMAGLGLPSDPRAVADLAENWRPWRSYALLHVWSTL
ncbi:DNA-3-methyladenine glycosylase 2 family protein [Jiangella mangrovi]|uniref:DNA-3-methyladenine glycosylase II n=1 Tax=Jiangella mangrovi TaxID=1524084 RepID=A0A7W9GP41_9ACTN|nr:DNA-3-methyladenine glycosylase 2 family protein [Jiangella mangrovi]MBB5787425.1 AraC family transcriptional regulator of adaptative response / DNA-3-methyladenine glycosylase II [Jiangella mangrovi]